MENLGEASICLESAKCCGGGGEDEIDPGTVVTMRDKSVNYRVRMDIVVLPCLRGRRSEFPTIP